MCAYIGPRDGLVPKIGLGSATTLTTIKQFLKINERMQKLLKSPEHMDMWIADRMLILGLSPYA